MISRWSDFVATPVALGLRVYVLMAPISILGAAFAVPGSSWNEVLQRLGMGVVAQLFVGVFLAIGWGVSQRFSRARGIVIVWVLAGYALRGTVLTTLFTAFDVPDQISPLMRVIGSMVTMSVWSLMLGAAIQARDVYHEELARSLSRVHDLEQSTITDDEPTEAFAADFDATRDRVVTALQTNGGGDLREWAQVIRRTIEEDLRPFSHRLWSVSAQGVTRWERLRQFSWRLVREPIPLVPATVVLFTLLAWNALLRYGPTDGGLTALVYGGSLGAIVLVLLFLRRHHTITVRTQNAVDLLGIAMLAPALVIVVSLAWSALPGEALAIFALALNGFAVVAVMLAIWAAIAGAKVSADRAHADVDALDVLIQARADTRSQQLAEAARYLHNSLQSRLLRIQVHASAGEASDELAREVDEANQLLEGLRLDRLPSRDAAVSELLAAAESWSGIVDVTVTVEEGFPLDHPSSPHIALFAQEAIANAIRHGGADVVVVHLTSQAGEPSATITDNGTWTKPGDIAHGRHGPLEITVARTGERTTVSATPLATWEIPSRSSR
ncbi:MAG TPA: hypothetical protein VIG24_07000 [Acidimicrobiia bacterium]